LVTNEDAGCAYLKTQAARMRCAKIEK